MPPNVTFATKDDSGNETDISIDGIFAKNARSPGVRAGKISPKPKTPAQTSKLGSKGQLLTPVTGQKRDTGIKAAAATTNTSEEAETSAEDELGDGDDDVVEPEVISSRDSSEDSSEESSEDILEDLLEDLPNDPQEDPAENNSEISIEDTESQQIVPSEPTFVQQSAKKVLTSIERLEPARPLRARDARNPKLPSEQRRALKKILELMNKASHTAAEGLTNENRKRSLETEGTSTTTPVVEPAVKKQKFIYLEPQIDPDIGPLEDNRPKRIRYSVPPPQDRDDAYFHLAIGRLEQQIEDFFSTYFCAPTTYAVDNDTNNPWDTAMSPEFLRFAEMVAEPDPHMGGWNRFMTDLGQRKWFLVGMLAKILEAKVFRELMFGATKGMNDMLVMMEKTLVRLEGYERTSLRAKTTRTLLGTYAVPPLFDESVLRTTSQITTLLDPLTLHLLQQHKSHSPCRPYPSPASQFQALHDIVSEAGHLALCMRLSSDIFHFVAERPGEPYNDETQYCVDYREFKTSKDNVSSVLAGANRNHLAGGAASPASSLLPAPHRALVKIAVWPSIKRYKRGNGLPGGENSGFRIFDICPAGVVCYWGIEKRDRDASYWRRERLEKFVESRRGVFAGNGAKLGMGVGVGVAAAAAAAAAAAVGMGIVGGATAAAV